ncbi:MAG: DNA (cytosine-5-)-methyltransferase [Rhodothermaceae bacterium TMED105]|nr:MAG: DNA (cytosine-5-)-methyltransferase [Rhodothermaceae bacterium TMED105]
MLRHTDLCSGIGGFSLGFQWADLSEPVLFCDTDPWCRKVLAKHWPDVPIAEDVKELANDPARLVPDCDILTAGYPCQPFSQAGKRGGEEDDRHIWPEIFAIVQAKRPTWCVFENVYGHVTLGLDQVLSDLEAEGYACRTFVVPACAVDAPHRRDRVWIVAHSACSGRHPQSLSRTKCSGRPDNNDADQSSQRRSSRVLGHTEDNGRNRWAKQTGREGQTDQPDQPGPSIRSEVSRPSENVADTDSSGCQKQWWGEPTRTEHKAPECGSWWKPEPSVGRVAHGIPRRVDRLKGLGNAIVPQIAMRIGQTIKAVNSCNTE